MKILLQVTDFDAQSHIEVLNESGMWRCSAIGIAPGQLAHQLHALVKTLKAPLTALANTIQTE